MKLTMIAIGSRGDVQPCVALGRGLAGAGFSVRIATLANFEHMVKENGLEFFPVEGDAQALVNEMMVGKNLLNIVQMYRSLIRTFGAITESYSDAFSNPELFDSDAILCQLPVGFYGYDLAERLNIPYIALSVIPQEMTGAWPLAVLPVQMSLGRAYNRLTYRIGQQMAWQPFRKPINRFRSRLGLPAASFFWGNIKRIARERVPVIQGFSEHVIPRQPEWGEHIHTTGYWTLDEPEWQPSHALTNFLAAGEPPVFIGFGSMPVSDPGGLTTTILQAFERSGRRGIISAGWANLGGDALPETVFSLDYAPYAWLFPQMAAVIHHGGSGTTGLALASGVPSMVVPFIADQSFWGKRTSQLGVGPKPIPHSKLNADNLTAAINTLCSTPHMRHNAGQLRAKMSGETGVPDAVRVISRILAP